MKVEIINKSVKKFVFMFYCVIYIYIILLLVTCYIYSNTTNLIITKSEVIIDRNFDKKCCLHVNLTSN